MDKDESSVPRRKVRFLPKAPRRKLKPTVPPTEADDDGEEAVQAQALLRQFNENLRRRGPRVEKKSSVQVAFGPGDASSASIRTYGTPKDGNRGQSSSLGLKGSDDEQILSTLPSAANEAGTDVSMEDATDASTRKAKKKYIECWDYQHTYYPTILPLRKPYSGNPEVLNKKEFGADAEREYDESTINPASELGLLEENAKEKMLLVQLPSTLPLGKRSTTAKGKEKVGSSTSLESIGAPKKNCGLEELSEGYMGKMLVFKSGAIKLKLGDVLYDVSPGSDCTFAQDVAVVNTAEKKCCVLGELITQRAVVTPNVDSLLNVVNLD